MNITNKCCNNKTTDHKDNSIIRLETKLVVVTAREDIGWNVDRVLANQSLNQQKQFLEVRQK